MKKGLILATAMALIFIFVASRGSVPEEEWEKDFPVRFEYEKFGSFSFKDFQEQASGLVELISDVTMEPVETFILSAEDGRAYASSTKGEYRRRYSLNDFDKAAWNRSMRAELFIKLSESPEPFMIVLTSGDFLKNNRMSFYGQCLDKQTRKEFLDKFCKRGFFYRLRKV